MDSRGDPVPDASNLARFRVTGRVQGVGFRWWATLVARELGLRGRVRNCPDGSVETVVSGDGELVDEFARRLRTGPSGARVDAVSRLPAPDDPLPDAFEIAY